MGKKKREKKAKHTSIVGQLKAGKTIDQIMENVEVYSKPIVPYVIPDAVRDRMVYGTDRLLEDGQRIAESVKKPMSGDALAVQMGRSQRQVQRRQMMANHKVKTTLPKMLTPNYKELMGKSFVVGTSTYIVTGIIMSAHPQIPNKVELKVQLDKLDVMVPTDYPSLVDDSAPTTEPPRARMRRHRDDT